MCCCHLLHGYRTSHSLRAGSLVPLCHSGTQGRLWKPPAAALDKRQRNAGCQTGTGKQRAGWLPGTQRGGDGRSAGEKRAPIRLVEVPRRGRDLSVDGTTTYCHWSDCHDSDRHAKPAKRAAEKRLPTTAAAKWGEAADSLPMTVWMRRPVALVGDGDPSLRTSAFPLRRSEAHVRRRGMSRREWLGGAN